MEHTAPSPRIAFAGRLGPRVGRASCLYLSGLSSLLVAWGLVAPAVAHAEEPTSKGPKPPEVVRSEVALPSASPFEQVFADSWFEKAQPVFEIHGYYRVRSEFFAYMDLGRQDAPGAALWPRPAGDDYEYRAPDGTLGHQSVVLCGDNPLAPEPCSTATVGGANTRLRIEPTMTVSDNVHVFAQVDFFDNLVLGSTPEGQVAKPGAEGGYAVSGRGGYSPIGAFASTQWSPTAGQNSLTDSVVVKRAWGEYISPFGAFRFGRMPNHWGLGMVYNSGDKLDQDYGSTVDRIQFTTGIKALNLYFSGMWDFADEGAVGGPFYGCRRTTTTAEEIECDRLANAAGRYQLDGRGYDLIQGDDVDQWSLSIVHRRDPHITKLALARGEAVVSGGFYGSYRLQTLDSFAEVGAGPRDVTESLIRRGYEAVIPDLWGELRWKGLTVGLEAAAVIGSIENTDVRTGSNFENPDDPEGDGWKLGQFGFALESSYRAVENRLRIDFGSGFATGDEDVEGITGISGSASSSAAPLGGLDQQLTRNRTYSTFRFHPDYQVDQLLFRRILGRIQSAYYFKPGVAYDFVRQPSGQRLGGAFNLIWSRAAEPIQTIGNAPDLGVELDTSIYFQSEGGTVDVAGTPKTGFYGQLDYSVLFPLAGLSDLPGDAAILGSEAGTKPAHMLRLFLGLLY